MGGEWIHKPRDIKLHGVSLSTKFSHLLCKVHLPFYREYFTIIFMIYKLIYKHEWFIV